MALYNILIKCQTVFPLSDDENKTGETMCKYPEMRLGKASAFDGAFNNQHF